MRYSRQLWRLSLELLELLDLVQLNIVDIRPEKELRKQWERFVVRTAK